MPDTDSRIDLDTIVKNIPKGSVVKILVADAKAKSPNAPKDLLAAKVADTVILKSTTRHAITGILGNVPLVGGMLRGSEARQLRNQLLLVSCIAHVYEMPTDNDHIVEDFAEIIAVSTELGDSNSVIQAAATKGQEAIDAAQRLLPAAKTVMSWGSKLAKKAGPAGSLAKVGGALGNFGAKVARVNPLVKGALATAPLVIGAGFTFLGLRGLKKLAIRYYSSGKTFDHAEDFVGEDILSEDKLVVRGLTSILAASGETSKASIERLCSIIQALAGIAPEEIEEVLRAPDSEERILGYFSAHDSRQAFIVQALTLIKETGDPSGGSRSMLYRLAVGWGVSLPQVEAILEEEEQGVTEDVDQ